MKLTQKLFWSLLLSLALTVVLMLGLIGWSLRSGFDDYLRAADAERLAGLAGAFAEHYDAELGWALLRDDPQRLLRLLHPELPPPPPPHPIPLELAPEPAAAVISTAPATPLLTPVAPAGTEREPVPQPPPVWPPRWREPLPGTEADERADDRRLPPPHRLPPHLRRHQAPPSEGSGAAPEAWRPGPRQGGMREQRPELTPGQALAQDPPGAGGATAASMTSASGTAAVAGSTPPPDVLALAGRLSLYDADQQRVLGRAAFADNSVTQAIRRDGRIVGWLGLTPTPVPKDSSATAYLHRQSQALITIALGALLLSALGAILLARHLLAPVKELVRGHRALRSGQFATRLPVHSHDEFAQLAADFNDLAQTLQKNEQSRRQWVADISHELRTPLTVLRAELESIQDGVYPMDGQRVNLLHRDVLQLAKLVEDLHELAVADLGALGYRKSPVRVDELLQQSADSFQVKCAARQLHLQLELDAGTGCVHGDAQKLLQLFTNLLENACRYTDAGGVIRLRSWREGALVRIEIADSAPGVPDWALPRLFERFFRVEKSRSRAQGGSGLGLAICKSIVDAHSGQLLASHSDLGGLSLRLSLPVATATRKG